MTATTASTTMMVRPTVTKRRKTATTQGFPR
jgi:hypothetical protein